MEKALYYIAFVIVLTSSVASEDNDQLACCPPSSYILNQTCYEPKKNTTLPLRLVCKEYYPYYKFNVKPGIIELLDFGYNESLSPDVVCYGNVTDNRNLTKIRSVALLCVTEGEENIIIGDTTLGYCMMVACYGNATKDRNLTKFKSVAMLCVTEEEEEIIIEDTTLGYCMIVSVVFLAITAIIYAIFSELRDLFGKSVINFCGSLAIGMGILSIMKLMEYTNMDSCAARGFLAYFFLMAAFFWTNSIAIQVLRDTRRPTSVDYGWKEFRWYVLYSWGLPTILTSIMAIVNYHPGEHDRPGIGLNHCWFLSKAQQWYYMYSVMTILLIINFAIFFYIATIVWRFTLQSSHIKALKFKLSMTIRLIVLMGLPWIFEMISSAVGGGSVILAIVDVINSLQGLLVFLVLVVRKRVVKVLYHHGLLDCCSKLVEKWLAVGDDAETNVVQHTDVPMQDDHHTNGHIRK